VWGEPLWHQDEVGCKITCGSLGNGQCQDRWWARSVAWVSLVRLIPGWRRSRARQLRILVHEDDARRGNRRCLLNVVRSMYPTNGRSRLVSMDDFELGTVAAAFSLGLCALLACWFSLIALCELPSAKSTRQSATLTRQSTNLDPTSPACSATSGWATPINHLETENSCIAGSEKWVDELSV